MIGDFCYGCFGMGTCYFGFGAGFGYYLACFLG